MNLSIGLVEDAFIGGGHHGESECLLSLQQVNVYLHLEGVTSQGGLDSNSIQSGMQVLVLQVGHSEIDRFNSKNIVTACLVTRVSYLDTEMTLVKLEGVVVVVSLRHCINRIAIIVEEVAMGSAISGGQDPKFNWCFAQIVRVEYFR